MVGLVFSLIYDEARKIWCYRWMLAATTAIIFIALAAYIFTIPKTYEAWGQLFVPKQTPLSAATDGVSLVGESYGSPYVIQKTMLNDENLARIVRQVTPGAQAFGRREMEGATGSLRNRISVNADEDGFIEFRITDTDPVQAQKVTKVLLDQFVTDNVSRSRRDLGQARTFLDEQIVSYEKLLLESQTQITAFRRQHPAVAAIPVAAGDTVGELASARAAYNSARASGGGGGGVATVHAPQDGAIADLENRLASLLMQYTEQYPDVVTTRRQIAALQAARGQSLAAAPPAAVAAAPANPAMTSARERLAVAQARAHAARPAAEAAPTLTAQWVELQRRNELLTTTYQDLLAKQEAAKLSQAVYGTASSGKYQLTRAPTVPLWPVGPNRPLYLAFAAVLAIGAGLAAAYIRGAIAGIFVSSRALEDTFQLPVIGTVSWEPAWHVQKSDRTKKRALGGAAQRALPSS